MTVTTTVKHRWGTREYARIESARFDPPHLHVAFADGAEVAIAVDRFDNPAIGAQEPDWTRAASTAHEVVVPTVSRADG